jgi:hypothetical protein
MTEEAARNEITDRAGIEFDPSVVSMFLSLDRFPELESFARIETDEPVEEQPVANSGRGWDLFSSFSK